MYDSAFPNENHDKYITLRKLSNVCRPKRNSFQQLCFWFDWNYIARTCLVDFKPRPVRFDARIDTPSAYGQVSCFASSVRKDPHGLVTMTAHSVEGVFSASQKIALTRATFLAYILPPAVCLYFMGVLVQLKGTRFYRLAFLPVVVWFSWRGIFVDMSGGDPRQVHMNTVVIVSGPDPVLHAIDMVYPRFICVTSQCGVLCGLLLESLFGVRVLRRNIAN